jgi:1-acyl-sn-glycerol-3-phosphate acyltransferase
MTVVYRVVTSAIRGALQILCQVDGAQLARVPDRGPLILVANHINFLEVPLLYTHLQPRPMTAFAKVETWDNPALGALADLWGAIPLERGESDVAALRQGLEALAAGRILALAPEGTRSGDGRLRRGHPGVALLALRSGAPILPLVHYGGEWFWRNLRRLRQTTFEIVVGEPFEVDAADTRVTRHVRQRITDEIMYQLAALLPPAYRGAYSDLMGATERYLRFPAGVQSNLRRGGEWLTRSRPRPAGPVAEAEPRSVG